MSRPTTMKVDGTVYWAIFTYTDAGVLVDADSTPTVAVRKNGASTADAVTVTKRAATTGIYDCSHAPSGEVDGDTFGYEETATVSAQAYLNRWSLEVTSNEVDVTSIAGNTGAATSLSASAGQITVCTIDTVVNTHVPTTTEFQSDTLTEATTDHYSGRVIVFTSGVLSGQATSISGYSQVGGIGQLTVVALTEAPADNDTFIIV